ncbi:MAG: hypothetical protein HUU41_12960 [Bryobacteraceae bacterium]|nr:hypothetical protein [Bryobacterales bacterium]MEB2362752.1 hypothetical protein [Bryobacterales bacterium]NUN02019.1 hypothetical protein [Bryobacteraceae bacterium]
MSRSRTGISAGIFLLALARTHAARPGQQIVVPTVKETVRNFAGPPPEYAMTLWWFWNGLMTKTGLIRDVRR